MLRGRPDLTKEYEGRKRHYSVRRYRERPLTHHVLQGRVVLSGDLWPGTADEDSLRCSEEGDDNVEE